MKNIKILFVSMLAIFIVSCDKLLEETPYNKVTAGNFYTTKEGVFSGVNGLYASLRNLYGNPEYWIYVCEGPSDIWTSTYGPEQFRFWTIDATSNEVKQLWDNCFIAINQCNSVIEALELNELPGLTDALRNRYLGEARFIRAHYFYHLVQQFGDIPMPLKPTNKVETDVKKASSNEVWEQILKDLKFSVENLPDQYNASDYGRITKFAAQHHLARVLLTVKRDQSDLQQALQYAESVIKSTHKLVPSHTQLWDINNKKNAEVLFSVLYTRNEELNGSGNAMFKYFTSDYSSQCPGIVRAPVYGHPWTRLRSTQYALDLFDESKDNRYNECFRNEWYINTPEYKGAVFNPYTKQAEQKVWQNGELIMVTSKERLTKEQVLEKWPVNVYLPEYMRLEIDPEKDVQSAENPNAPWPSNTRFMFYNFYSYLIKHQDPTRIATGSNGQRDVFVFRLADTYLLAGEIAYLLGEKEKAMNYINVVRERAAIPGKEREMHVSISDISIDFILEERARELMGEMHRWYDLKRTGKLEEYMNDPKRNPDLAGKFKDYHVLRPIPRDQLLNVTNPNEFTQNPGYGN